MTLILYLSDMILPFVLFYIIASGLTAGRPVYDDFVEGAKDGFRTVLEVMPTLIGLMAGVSILRASGFLSFLAGLLSHFISEEVIRPELISVILVKLFSSSAATGLALDIFSQFGADSLPGLSVSLMLSCTETIFYTMSVYFMSVKIKKTRYTLPGALAACAAGIVMSLFLGRQMQL